ncbi:DUF4132 domain-containing protein [Photobacterium galatheae]|uniref:DUF4132 domain-containing protein n=1 Tax=Photobacterium galatheae TaxID=1654360 RepID=A0A066RRL7_9GAMM|nr:DUF4132 domain-containing protein [Photobacterium galatheae]KDM90322.1 hypothetical protein EA58_17655 [Photobacterium galatheae]MCM0150797.1 DUF4132 domain-containing protein [Photobacterium galatheae]
MNISQVIDALRESGYYQRLVPEQSVINIRNFVYGDMDYADFPPNPTMPGFFMSQFFRESLEELEDTPEHIARYLHALALSVENKSWVTDVNIGQLKQWMPTFHDYIMSPSQLMKRLYDDEYDAEDGIERLRENFSKAEIRAFLENDSLKTNGHYNDKHHLYCRYVWFPELEEAVADKDPARFETLLITYLQALAHDYANATYIPSLRRRERDGDNKQYRTSLPPEAIQALTALLQGQGNWDQDPELIRSHLNHEPIYKNDRTAYTLLEADEDFSALFSWLCDSEDEIVVHSTAATNLKQLVFLLDPNVWVEQHFMHECYHYCSWSDEDEVMEELTAAIEAAPDKKDQLIAFTLRYTFEHYDCAYGRTPAGTPENNPHNQLIRALFAQYGTRYIWEMYAPRSIIEQRLGYYTLASLAEDGSLSELKDDYDRQWLTGLSARFTKNDKDAQLLFNYLITGENESQISKLAINPECRFGTVCYLEDSRLQRLTRVMLNGKNTKLFPRYLIGALRLFSSVPLRLISDVVLEKPAYHDIAFKAYAEFAEAFAERNEIGDDGYRWQGIEFTHHIAAEELDYLMQHGMACVSQLSKQSTKYKVILLPMLKGRITVTDEALLLVDLLKEKQKGVIAATKACLNALPETLRQTVREKILAELASFNAQQEVNAIEVLCEPDIDSDMARALLERVQSTASRTLLVEKGNLDFTQLYVRADGQFDLDAYLAESYTAPKKAPLDLSLLPLPERIDGQPANDAVMQLCLIYQNHEGYRNSQEAHAIAGAFTPASLSQFAHSLLSGYGPKVTAKNKWIMTIPAIHGDASVMKALATLTEKFANGSKHQLAGHLMKLMGLSGQTQAYMEIDRICRNTKKQSVKDAANEAFVIGAKQAGITKDELGDQLVDDLGFVGDQIPLEYCGQTLALILNEELKFVIRKPDGKLTKTLPKPKQDDDAEQAEQAKQHFNALKKLLKDMVGLQVKRMEDAFVAWRMWSFERWRELFLVNPVMNKIASQLVWGVYENNQLVSTFLPNPEPVDMEDEPFAFPANGHIGLVHPTELSSEQLAAWQGYFDDWNLEPLFGQLSRDVVELQPAKGNQYHVPCFSRKSPSTVVNRLRKNGWAVGSVRDAGSFDEMYKELDGLDVGIEITFDESIWHGGYGYESHELTVTAKTVEFYRPGRLHRGSYVYDDLQEEEYAHLRLTADDLPERVARELLLEAKKAFL